MVEHLAYILCGHFDKEIKDKYNDYIKIIRINVIDYAEDNFKEIKEIYKKMFGKEEFNEIPYKDIKKILIMKQLKEAKLLFVELMLLLKRVDYLKGIVYGEATESTEVIEVDKN